MDPVLLILLLVLAVVVLLGVGYIVSYNRFVAQRNTVEESWRQVDVELQRRYDLIPNLVETVRASAQFEQSTLQQVIAARSHAMQARQAHASVHDQSRAEQQLTGALHGFLGLAESYPQLQSNQNFLHLQKQLADTEDRIAAGRRFYNGNVRALNTRVQSIPSSIVASIAKIGQAEYFEVDDPYVRASPSLTGAFDSLHRPGPQQQAPQQQWQPQAGLPPHHGQAPQTTPPPAAGLPQANPGPQGFGQQVAGPQGFGQPGPPRQQQPQPGHHPQPPSRP
ncbi:LemA protein [Actinoalloteichus hoggarensis]|uniref:LemA family protein n=1 Tax=Actinoalloteichus hoggarensis TaxID=1470176 RepID=UPI000B8ACF43|nr:LemA family protein [Actinoalloteichus hoggarensis]MBB5922641.1 LemA protein [Actinoalloteichus hoggarensis]